MLFTQLLFAASAAAMLVVPDTADTEDGIFRTLPHDVASYDVPSTAFTHSIEVPCQQCRGRDTHLQMDFTIEDKTRLMLNGFELYPNADPWQGDLSAAVVKGNGHSKDRRLGYGLSVRPEGMDEEQQLEIIAIGLLVIEVGDRFIEGVPLVQVKLVKAANGEILIGSISMAGSEGHVDTLAQCSSLWCTVPTMFDGVWESLKSTFKSKGCGGMRGHGHGHKSHHNGHGNTGEETDSIQVGEKHGHHGEHKSHHHHHHSWSVVKHITSYIFLPVLMGITAGVGVAMLAMFLGTLAMRVMRLIKGERQEAPLYADCERKIDIIEFLSVDEEKAGLIMHQEAAPEYESEDENARN
ncbi:hypothetical protein B0J13DRAFT_541882 [Dactylonectria estremocensis]|uniref:DUF7728 domain-containing protein n=1 Tax=Dactylonectria estremocensis TaxID=1079267 RepID=A0A9P9FBJ5_9HYPO|nr:hypothetical protein B0J13DRAFT_541882 [Dactylonectria estremocensis]